MPCGTAGCNAGPPLFHNARMNPLLNAAQTADSLPWAALADEIEALLQDPGVQVPARIVLPTAHGAVLFCMPGSDARCAMTKLITLTPANAGTARPLIQGDVTVFDVATGERRLVLHGPTVTARRTAAVSALAARHLAAQPHGPMLIVGAGVQGLAHAQAFADVCGVRQFVIASRQAASAQALARQVQALGWQAEAVDDANAALAHCPLVATCTPARGVVLHALPRPDAFIAAVGAFTPQMIELAPDVTRHIAATGRVVVDTADAAHEAGDLLQAGLNVPALPTLADVVRSGAAKGGAGPVLFKSCGWAGWDLAAARLALGQSGGAGGAMTA